MSKEDDEFFLDKVRKEELRVKRNGRVINTATGRELGSTRSDGYRRIYMKSKYRIMRIYVHRLVYIVRKGNIPEGYELNHKNSIRSDNRVSNLELCTRNYNIKYSFNAGISRSEDKRPNKLSHKKAKKIKKLYNKYNYSIREISNLYDVSKPTISKIVNSKAWGELTKSPKLSWKIVKDIRELYDNQGYTTKQLQDKYDVARSTIERVIRRDTWT